MPSRTFYITTPIYYVNDVPHIGHAYTTILADVLNRYHRLFGEETFFLTGTDEHGQKVQQAAEKRGVSPKEHCDLFSQRFLDTWNELDIGYDHFIRTTDPSHIAFVRTQTQKLWDKGLVYSKDFEGWYSTSEERFFTEKELVDGKDPISGRAVEWIKEKNYFFKMSSYQAWLLAYIEANPDFILPDFRRNEVLGFLRQHLNDLCISRPKSRLAWGISLPFDEDYVAYVWVDALLNYASAVSDRHYADGSSLWPADCHLIGKDILTTHAVYWPTMLKALDLPLPRHILAHGWWLIDNARMSKTTGNVISPLAMKDKYGVDAFRHFLIREMSVGQDASFSEEAFVGRLNADLANDLGNGLSRVAKLAQTLNSTLSACPTVNEVDQNLRSEVQIMLDTVPEKIAEFKPGAALEAIMQVFRAVNRYLELTAPWKLAKGSETDLARLGTVLWHCTESLRLGFTLLQPVMPTKMRIALESLGLSSNVGPLRWRDSAAPFRIFLSTPLFPRVLFEPPVTPWAVEDPFAAVDLRVAKIVEVADHPNADSLYIVQIDLGGEKRTVCAGLRKHVPKESLIDLLVVVVANLKVASLRGVQSQGMLLASEGKDGVLTLVSPQDAKRGDSVRATGLTTSPKPQITLKEFEACPLQVRSGQVWYRDFPLETNAGKILSQAPDGSTVR